MRMSEWCEHSDERTSEWPRTRYVYSLIIRLTLDLREMGRPSLCVVDEKVAASRRHFRQKPAV